MDRRAIRRRAFWIGFRSIWDLSGKATTRDLQRLARETARPPAWHPQQPRPWRIGTATVSWKPPPGTTYT